VDRSGRLTFVPENLTQGQGGNYHLLQVVADGATNPARSRGPKQQVLPPHEKIHCCRMQTRGEVANCPALWQIESPKSGGGAGVEMTTGTYPPGTGMEAFFYPCTGTDNPTDKTYFFHN
jgi:hypothetical protein